MVQPIRVPFLGDATQLAREARKAQESLDGVNRHAHTMSTALGTAFGTVAGRGIAAVAGAATRAVGSIGMLASASLNAASDMNESLSKNQAVFGQSADAVKAWASDNTKNILLTRQAAIEGAATFGNLFTALKIGQGDAAGMSTKLVGLASDLSSFNNVGTDEALLALRSGLLGEAEPLRKFGVTLSQTRIEAEAFALGLAKPVKNAAAITAAHNAVAAATAKVASVEKEHGKGSLAAAQAQDGLARANASLSKAMGGQKVELTAAQKAQAAYSIILKDTTTAQGDAARTQDGYANSSRIMHKRLEDLQATLGQKLLPYATRTTKAVSDLVEEFENGTGAGGELRDDLVGIGQAAQGLGEDLKPVVGVVKWFAEHPEALKGAVEGMVAYRIATKSAALWSERLAAANVAEKLTGVAAVAPGAAAGVSTVAGALSGLTLIDIAGWGAAAIGVLERLSDLAKGLGGDIGPLLNRSTFGLGNRPGTGGSFDAKKYADSLPPDKREQFYQYYPELRPNIPAFSSGELGAVGNQARKNMPAYSNSELGAIGREKARARDAAAAAKAVKENADKQAAAQKYAADQAEKSAKLKAAAAEAMQKATDALQSALSDRRQEAQGVHDSLVSSTSILRSGVSWTAKDLLSRFQNEAHKLQQFQTGLSSAAAHGISGTIIRQAAQGGVGNLGAVLGLAHARPGEIRQINALQKQIDKYATGVGNTAARSMGPINISIYLDSNKLAPGLARAVATWNAQQGYNGSRLVA